MIGATSDMSYGVMLFGAAASALLAVVLTTLLSRTRRPFAALAATSGLSALAGPLAWNLILRATGAFSHDIPFKPFPISWQDTGSAVFTLAAASTAIGLSTALPTRQSRRPEPPCSPPWPRYSSTSTSTERS